MIEVDCTNDDCAVWVDVVRPTVHVTVDRPMVKVDLPACPDGGVGGGSVGSDEVLIGPDPPPASSIELWVDTAAPDPPGEGGSLPSRATKTLTTASLAPDAMGTGVIDLSAAYRLYRVAASHECRLRLYTTAAKRDADASRPIGSDPVGDHGLMLEFVFADTLLGADLSPMVDGFDGKEPPDGSIPWSVTNTGASSADITITLVFIAEEG